MAIIELEIKSYVTAIAKQITCDHTWFYALFDGDH